MVDEDDLLRTQIFADLDNTVAILGAGFSVPAGVPPTGRISERFLTFDRPWPTPAFIQPLISKHLAAYWRNAFSYEDGPVVPSFEDHFTLLDLAANSGHNLGPYMTPAVLRALRRLSIHRVFDLIDVHQKDEATARFLDVLCRSEDTAIVSLNWDIIAENHLFALEHSFHYDMPGAWPVGADEPEGGIPIVKLHGSANWQYCDSCHATLFGQPGGGKTALHDLTFIEPRDFASLREPDDVVARVREAKQVPEMRSCRRCGARRLGARVATFSYSKAFGFFLFQAAWDAALHRLMRAQRWIFVGYSLPEADFAFRHLLKMAQLNSSHRFVRHIWVVLKEDDAAAIRYRKFFGLTDGWIDQSGLEVWVPARMGAAP